MSRGRMVEYVGGDGTTGGVAILGPTDSHDRYRCVFYSPPRHRRMRSGGKTLKEARVCAGKLLIELANGTDFDRGPAPLWSDAVEDYLSTPLGRGDSRRRPDLAAATFAIRKRRFAQMLRSAPSMLRCDQVDRDVLDQMRVQAGTRTMVVQNTTALRCFLRWGQGKYFSPQQADLLPVRCVVPAPALVSSPAPLRKDGVRRVGRSEAFVPDEDAPSLAALEVFGNEMELVEPVWGKLCVELAYTSGLRWGEQFALDVDDVMEHGRPDPDRGLIWLNVLTQVEPGPRSGDVGDERLNPPKGRKTRMPFVTEYSFTGYALGRALRDRCVAARAEQAAGTNPLGLLFPSPRGKVWHHSSFSRDRFTPAAIAAEWPFQPWRHRAEVWDRTTGRYILRETKRTVWQHPWHSLRHRYARICVDEFELGVGELMEFGGWESHDVVSNRYYRSGQEHHVGGAAQVARRQPVQGETAGARARRLR